MRNYLQFPRISRKKLITESSADSEENGVVVHLLHDVVLEQDTGVGVHIGPGVLDLASFSENWWDNHVQVGHELEHLVVGQVLEGELALAGVTGVGLTENGMTVTGDNLE